jgi:predicted DNA-binding transcriptional regulator YafY
MPGDMQGSVGGDEGDAACPGGKARTPKEAKGSKTKRWLFIISRLNDASLDGERLSTRQIHESICEDLCIPDTSGALRNTQRDLEEIQASGIIALQRSQEIAVAPRGSGQPGSGPPERIIRWWLDDNPLNLEASRVAKSPDALILLLASEHLKPLLPPDIAARLVGLATQGRKYLERRTLAAHWIRPWQSKVRIAPRGHRLGSPVVDPAILAAVYKALDQHKRLQVTYFYPGKRDRPETLVCDPLGLVYRDPLSYLVVSRDGRSPHTLALHRIKHVEELPGESTAARDFDLDAFLADDGIKQVNQTNVRVRVWATPGMSDHWEAAPLGREQAIEDHPAGGRVVNALVHDTDELRRYLLGLGSQVQVLEPESIRAWIRQQADHLIHGAAPVANRAPPVKGSPQPVT